MGDIAYEADRAYYIQSHGTERPNQPPDLAVEIVVTHSETKALQAGAVLKIPEMWVVDLPRRGLTIYHLAVRGKAKGTYRPEKRSRVFPVLTAVEVQDRLDEPASDDFAYLEDCRAWARRVLVPRRNTEEGGA